MHVGEIIHRLRKERKMTLAELSEKSGVALATLSRVENGKMTGTLDSHIHICEALDIELPNLYKDLTASKKVVEMRPKNAPADVFVHDKRASAEMLASNVLTKKMLPTLIRIQKGGVTHKEETKPSVEKFLYILDGKVDVHLGTDVFDLTKGDTLYFAGSIPHFIKNTGTSEARIIIVSCPPVL